MIFDLLKGEKKERFNC